jgi:hypothetical protein
LKEALATFKKEYTLQNIWPQKNIHLIDKCLALAEAQEHDKIKTILR